MNRGGMQIWDPVGMRCVVVTKWFVAFLFGIGAWGPLLGQTYVNRGAADDPASARPLSLRGETVWQRAGSPYVIEARFIIESGATLNVEPGVVVQAASGQVIEVFGTLKADGATFEAGEGGAWRGFYFGSNSSESVVENCLIQETSEDVGLLQKAFRRAALFLEASSPTIRGNEIKVPSGHGIELFGSQAIIEANQFEIMSAEHFAVTVGTAGSFPKFAGNTASGDGRLGVALPGGRLSLSGTWSQPGPELPYLVQNPLVLNQGIDLTIEAGTTVQFPMVNWQVLGTLIVAGTEAEPVKFLGPWLGMIFAPSSTESRLSYCEIHDAGAGDVGVIGGVARRTALYLANATPALNHVTIERSGGNGIELDGSSVRLQFVTIRDAARYAVMARGNSLPVFAGSRFIRNGSEGFATLWADSNRIPVPGGATFVDNHRSGIEVPGGVIQSDLTWPSWGANVPYFVNTDLTVAGGVTWTIDPGTILKLDNGRLVVNGTLVAEGTDVFPITLTSSMDDSVGGDSNGDGDETMPMPGDWRGIYLGPQAGESRFRHCRFGYGGGESVGFLYGEWRQTTLYVDQCSPVLQSNEFTQSAGNGLELFGTRGVFERNRFMGTAPGRQAIFYHRLNNLPTLSGNEASGPGGGIGLPAGNILVAGVWEKPGDDFPYLPQGDLGIPAGTTLTLEPGVRFESAGHRMIVEGTLLARGTADERVVFDGLSQDGGVMPWKGILFAASSSASELTYATLLNGGGEDLGVFAGAGRRTSIYVAGASPVFQQLNILAGRGSGIEIAGSVMRLSNSLIARNQGPGIVVRGPGGNPQVHLNTIANNGSHGVLLENADAELGSNLIALNSGAGLSGALGTLDASNPVRHNLFFENIEGQTPEWLLSEAGELVAENALGDPRFRNPDAWNYRLQEGSAAIDQGMLGIVDPFGLDLDGRVRVHGERADRGAYEFNATEPSYSVDLSVRREGDEWSGEAIVFPSPQSFAAFVAPGQEAVYQLRLRNTGNQLSDVSLQSPALPENWRVTARLDDEAGSDISAAIFGGKGYQWRSVPPGNNLIINLSVGVVDGGEGQNFWNHLFTASSARGGRDEISWVAAVLPLPVIGAQPEDRTVDFGGSVQFRVEVTGLGSIRYQWRKDGEPIPGATQAELLLDAVTVSDTGDYSVDVIGGSGTVTSRLARLEVVGEEPVEPLVLSFARLEQQLRLEWVGGRGPYRVLGKESLSEAEWTVLAEGLTETAFVIGFEAPAQFLVVTGSGGE